MFPPKRGHSLGDQMPDHDISMNPEILLVQRKEQYSYVQASIKAGNLRNTRRLMILVRLLTRRSSRSLCPTLARSVRITQPGPDPCPPSLIRNIHMPSQCLVFSPTHILPAAAACAQESSPHPLHVHLFTLSAISWPWGTSEHKANKVSSMCQACILDKTTVLMKCLPSLGAHGVTTTLSVLRGFAVCARRIGPSPGHTTCTWIHSTIRRTTCSGPHACPMCHMPPVRSWTRLSQLDSATHSPKCFPAAECSQLTLAGMSLTASV